MDDKHISSAVIRRLPRYYRYLCELNENGVERISSEELSKMMHATASQVRQDLNNFGGFGQQGYGYNVERLRDEVAEIMGLRNANKIIIIGAGNLGKAIAGYPKFETRRFIISGMFDNNPELYGTWIRNIEIKPIEEIPEFLKKHDVSIACLTVPKEVAIDMAEMLYKQGIRAFWNFAHVDIRLPSDAYVENVHLTDSLMQLTYKLHHNR